MGNNECARYPLMAGHCGTLIRQSILITSPHVTSAATTAPCHRTKFRKLLGAGPLHLLTELNTNGSTTFSNRKRSFAGGENGFRHGRLGACDAEEVIPGKSSGRVVRIDFDGCGNLLCVYEKINGTKSRLVKVILDRIVKLSRVEFQSQVNSSLSASWQWSAYLNHMRLLETRQWLDFLDCSILTVCVLLKSQYTTGMLFLNKFQIQ